MLEVNWFQQLMSATVDIDLAVGALLLEVRKILRIAARVLHPNPTRSRSIKRRPQLVTPVQASDQSELGLFLAANCMGVTIGS